MKWFEFPFALLGVLLIAALTPPWIWFVNEYTGNLGTAAQFIAQFILPAMLLLFLASWVDPGGA